MPAGYPVECGLNLSTIRCIAPACVRIVCAVQLGYITLRIFYVVVAADEIGIAQPDFPARGQAEKLFGRFFHKIILLDVQLARERDLELDDLGVEPDRLTAQLQRARFPFGASDRRVALSLGLGYLAAAVRFWFRADSPAARGLFRTSLVYLPLLLILLSFDSGARRDGQLNSPGDVPALASVGSRRAGPGLLPMSRTFLVATRNEHKLQEIQDLLDRAEPRRASGTRRLAPPASDKSRC